MKSYVKPMMEIQMFAANEVIAACGDTNNVYKFRCNAPAGTLYGPDRNGKMQERGSFHPCPASHTTTTDDVFENGFIDYNRNGKEDSGEQVIIWRYEHATKDLNKNSWETAKS